MFSTRHVLTLLLIGLWVVPLVAQDTATDMPTATPAPAFFSSWRADNAFPVGAIFAVGAILPEQTTVDGLRLTLSGEGMEPQVLMVNRNDDTVFTQNGVIVDAQITWEIDRVANAPVWPAELTYRWDMLLSNGETDTVQDVMLFEDMRTTWDTTQAPNAMPLTMTTAEDDISARLLLDGLVRPYNRLRQHIGPLSTPHDLLIFTPRVPLGCDVGSEGVPVVVVQRYAESFPCNLRLARAIYEKSGYTVIELERAERTAAQTALTHWLVDEVYADVWAGNAVPEWYQAGMRALYDVPSEADRLALSKGFLRSGQVFSLETLDDLPDEDDPNYMAWEAQSVGLVIYIAQRFGLDTAYALAMGAEAEDDEAGTFADVYAARVNEPLEALIPAWEVWLFSEEAAGAYAVNLYSDPTPLPSVTPTRTRIPPTPTVTRTPTITPTPSDTPTPTPIPPTATVTPRPASSVFTPTPTLTPIPADVVIVMGRTVDQQAAQNVLLGVMGFALVLVLLGVLASAVRRDDS